VRVATYHTPVETNGFSGDRLGDADLVPVPGSTDDMPDLAKTAESRAGRALVGVTYAPGRSMKAVSSTRSAIRHPAGVRTSRST